MNRVEGKLVNKLMELRVRSEGHSLYVALEKDAQNSEAVQWRVLQEILKAHENTFFGKVHRFKEIDSLESFRKFVPVHEYETLRSWVDNQDLTGRPAINPDNPTFYAVTSGTTGKPKYIPVMKSSLKSHKQIQNLFLYKLMKERPDVMTGHILAVVSPAVEGYRPESGNAFGSTSGQMYLGTPKLVRKKYIVPPAVFTIDDYDLKYLLILRLALRQDDITYLSTANPSTIVRLTRLLNSHWKELYQDLKDGGFSRMKELNRAQQNAIRTKLGARRARAEELNATYARNGSLKLKDILPVLQAVGCWTGGSCAIFFDQLRGEFPEQTLVRDIGYLSSEFRGTVVLSSESNAGIPTFQHYFFEFVEQSEWEDGKAKFQGLHQLRDKARYYIFVTSDAGLYRYNMNDIIEVDGFFHKTPKMRFVQKGKGVTNITGEKLYESQIISSLRAAEKELGLDSSFYMMLADVDAGGYRLVYEPRPDRLLLAQQKRQEVTDIMERELCGLNMEYATKRKSGRLKEAEFMILRPGTFEEYKQFCLRMGQRESQFKIIALQYKRDLRFEFAPFAVDARVRPEEARDQQAESKALELSL